MNRGYRALFILSFLIGVMVLLEIPVEATHEVSGVPRRKNYDFLWYAYDDASAGCTYIPYWSTTPACYSTNLFDDRMYDALNDPSPDYNQFGWSRVSESQAQYWARSWQHADGHHRTNMATIDFDCKIAWAGMSPRPHGFTPCPGAVNANVHLGATQFFWECSVTPCNIYFAHAYINPGEHWSQGTGCCLSGTDPDLWAVLEHELGHGISGMVDLYTAGDPNCPADHTYRATMCSIARGTWRQRTPNSHDISSMNWNL